MHYKEFYVCRFNFRFFTEQRANFIYLLVFTFFVLNLKKSYSGTVKFLVVQKLPIPLTCRSLVSNTQQAVLVVSYPVLDYYFNFGESKPIQNGTYSSKVFTHYDE